MKPVAHGGLALVEDAIALLQSAPTRVLAYFYVGALPFVLSLLYFWADMSRGAFADARLTGTSLVVASLYLWMKAWHTVFGRELLAHLGEEPPLPWTLARAGRLLAVQTTLQPWALLVRPMALLATLPYGWVRAWFENVTILGDSTESSIREICRRAAAQARLWPMPHLQSLSLLFLFGICVLINAGVLIVSIPFLLKTFLGVETAFTSSSYSIFNSTFFASAFAASWLCINPITKAVHVLRCFHGAALHTGADLRITLRKIRRTAVLVLLFSFLPGIETVHAAPVSAVEAQTLDRRIEEVLQRREFVWREPREFDPGQHRGWLDGFFKDVEKHVKAWLRPVKKWAGGILRWMEDWFRNRQPSDFSERKGMDWGQPAKWLVACLSLALVTGLFLFWRKSRRRRPVLAQEEAVVVVPDLTMEEVSASQLPEEGWLSLAHEMIARGELRLALRAFYLANLTLLGGRQWITLERHKSNRDYQRELKRRGRGSPVALENFSVTLDVFERVWYGHHAVTQDTLAEAEARLERMRAC